MIRPEGRPRKTWGVSSILLLASLLGEACHRSWCVDGLELRRTYQTTVLDRVSRDSIYGVQGPTGADFGLSLSGTSCGVGFDFVPGSVFEITPESRIDYDGCYGRIGTPSSLAEVQLVEQVDYPSHARGELMTTPAYNALRGSNCMGAWQLEYISPRHSPPLDAPVPGTYPAVLLYRSFDAFSGSCPELSTDRAACADYFVIALEST
jgi:hypothetical protein